jgi:lysophospholipase L1-like esterase
MPKRILCVELKGLRGCLSLSSDDQRSTVFSFICRATALALLGLLTVASPALSTTRKKKPAPKPGPIHLAPPARKPAHPKKGGIRSKVSPILHHSFVPHRGSRYSTPTRSTHSSSRAYSPAPIRPLTIPSAETSSVGTPAVETSRVDTTEQRPNTPQSIQLSLTDPAFSIEGAKYLAPFFANLKALQASPGSSEVRILHFGDSHTAADIFTNTVRTLFQDRFGNGGAGFSLAGYPFRGYRIHGTKREMSTGWSVLGTYLPDIGDAMVGMGGVSMQTTHSGDWVSLDTTASSLRVQYLIQPGGGDIAIYDGETLLQTVPTAGDNYAGGVFTTNVAPGDHHFEVRTLNSAPVRLLGFVTENAGGITYEAMGINGAEASIFLRWNEAIQQEIIQDRPPSLIVLDYGTNEASDHTWTEEGYETMFQNIILRCHQLAPGVPILVIGPPDRALRVGRHGWEEFAGVDRIIAAQRAVCRKMGCAFWDWRKRMGGFGAMREWTAAGWAQPDHTHFTTDGYNELAATFFSDIFRQYQTYTGATDTTAGSIQ